ncbi:MAG: hypothetical protein ACUVUG_08285 [Candidatus Aminicenantia bacterium]
MNCFFFIRFYLTIEKALELKDACHTLNYISVNSSKIFSGIEVGESIKIIKYEEESFDKTLRKLNDFSDSSFDSIFSLWSDIKRNLDFLVKNERDSKDFFRAYSEISNSIKILVDFLKSSEKIFEKKAKSKFFIMASLNFLTLISLGLLIILSKKEASINLKKKRENLRAILKKLDKDVEELSDEIEDISTKTLKLSLRKSENGFSTISSSMEEMRNRIDGFLKESFVKEEKELKVSLERIVEALSLSLNNIITSTMVEMEKFKDMENSIEKLSGKFSTLKNKVLGISFFIRDTENQI